MAQPAIIDGNLINDARPLAVETQAASVATIQEPLTTDSLPVAGAAADVNVPAVNTAAVVTYAAVAGVRHVITGMAWSYYGQVPVGGSIIVTDAGATVFSEAIADEGCGFFIFPEPKQSAIVNTAIVITLAAGGAACFGRLNILNHWTA